MFENHVVISRGSHKQMRAQVHDDVNPVRDDFEGS